MRTRFALAISALACTINADDAWLSCDEAGDLTLAGSTTTMVDSWANSYPCEKATIQVGGGGSFVGARRVCAADSNNPAADVAIMSRPWLPTEATVQDNGFTFDCLIGDTSRSTIQVQVATDAIAFFVGSDGAANRCIETLGGLTLDQLRYIFSSYTFEELKKSGTWDPDSVPNPDPPGDSEKYWSELDSSCAKERIVTVGPGSSTGINEVVLDSLNFDVANGETLKASIQWFVAPSTAEIVGYPTGDTMAIGYAEHSYLSVNPSIKLSIVPVKNGEDFALPSLATIEDSTYSLTNPVYMNVLKGSASKAHPFLNHGFMDAEASDIESLGFVSLSIEEQEVMLKRLETKTSVFIGCFPSDSFVHVPGKGPTPIQNLALGDEINAAPLQLSRVYSFGHYDPHVEAEYLDISVNDNDKPLVISPNHMVFVQDQPVPAGRVVVGDWLTLHDRKKAQVTLIERATHTGAFAPFTEAGTLVVNGILVSSYVTLQEDSAIWTMGGDINIHTLSHLYQAPHRVMCKLVGCKSETYDHGISVWYIWPLRIARWLLQQNEWVALILATPVMIIALIASAIEMVISNPSRLFIFIATWFATKEISDASLRLVVVVAWFVTGSFSNTLLLFVLIAAWFATGRDRKSVV